MNPKQAFGDKKPPLSMLPLSAHIHGALAFYDGAGKYGKLNWRENPVESMTYVEAMLRHARLWENGEEFARDTKVHNLGGVIACAALLLDAQANDCLIDNRVFSQANCDLLHAAEVDIARLKEQHIARRAQADVDEAARVAVEEGKRHQASEALELYQSLVEESMRSTSPKQDYEIRQRSRAARDVLLNMVNGVFPEPFVPEGAEWMQEVVRTSDFNPTVERHGEGDMVSPPVDRVYPKPPMPDLRGVDWNGDRDDADL